MPRTESTHLKRLRGLLGDRDPKHLFACIEDLVAHGLSLDRFSGEEPRPTRQDVTQFIAAWLRHVGVGQDACRDWMIDYCTDVLASLSSSSRSRIRHSTRSNLRYIYGAEVAFACRCEHNLLRARCDRACPVYDAMAEAYRQAQEARSREAARSWEPQRAPHHVPPPRPSVKEVYREQFEKAMAIVADRIKKGVPAGEIIAFLNEHGYRTRTGRAWTVATFQFEVRRRRAEQGPEAEAGQERKEWLPVKKRYREQFERAMAFVADCLRKGIRGPQIVSLLNERDFKTRTGRTWTYETLRRECRKAEKDGKKPEGGGGAPSGR